MSPHTPGPWAYEYDHGEYDVYRVVNEGREGRGVPIGAVYAGTEDDRDECEANARLIAHAPTIHALLESCLWTLEHGATVNPIMLKDIRAILKEIGW